MNQLPSKGARQAPTVRAALLGLVLSLSAHVLPETVRAGGWTQPPGSYYVKIWDRSLIALNEGTAFDTEGEVIGGLSGFQDHQLNLYAEYGLIDTVTLLAFSTPVGWARFDGNSTAYVGATGLGARVRLLDASVKLAVQTQYSYAPPIGDDSIADAPATAPPSSVSAVSYSPTASTHAGEIQLQAGYGLNWGWLTASGGFRANSEGAVGHAITGFAQLGVSRLSHFTFDLHINVYQSLDDIEVINVAGAGRTSYLGLGLGAGYAVTQRVALVASFESVAYAKSNAGSPSLALGVELRPIE